MTSRKLRVGQPITPQEFDELSDEELEGLVPPLPRVLFRQGRLCRWFFYLHDGTAYSFYRGGLLDE